MKVARLGGDLRVPDHSIFYLCFAPQPKFIFRRPKQVGDIVMRKGSPKPVGPAPVQSFSPQKVRLGSFSEPFTDRSSTALAVSCFRGSLRRGWLLWLLPLAPVCGMLERRTRHFGSVLVGPQLVGKDVRLAL